jgi:hypothetical protein
MVYIRNKGEDIMHLLFENVAKEILSALQGDINPVEDIDEDGREHAPRLLSETALKQLLSRIEQSIVPSQFQKPPSLHLKNWRAIDFQTFFCVFAPSVLYGTALDADFYSIILLFYMSSRILSSDEISRAALDIADSCLIRLYMVWSSLTDRVKLSFHRLVHLVQKTRDLGPLARIWLYSFERLFGNNARSIVGANQKFSQLMNNIADKKLSWIVRQHCPAPVSTSADIHSCRKSVSALIDYLKECGATNELKEAFAATGIADSVQVFCGRLYKNHLRFAEESEIRNVRLLYGDEFPSRCESRMPVLSVDRISASDWKTSSHVFRTKQRKNASNDGHVAYLGQDGKPMFGIVNSILFIPLQPGRLEHLCLVREHRFSKHTSQFRASTLQHVIKIAADVDPQAGPLVAVKMEDIVSNVVLIPVDDRPNAYFASVTSRSSAALSKFVLDDQLLNRDWMKQGNLYALLSE